MKIVVCLLSGMCAIAHGFFSVNCPPGGWLEYHGHCYQFSVQQKMKYSEAEIYCQQQNSHLADVRNSGENDFIRTEMKKIFSTRGGDTFWLGIKDDIVEGEWRYPDTNTPMNFTAWYPGQPNHDDTEDCMVAPGYFDFSWGDYNCNDPCCYPVCKKHTLLKIVGK